MSITVQSEEAISIRKDVLCSAEQKQRIEEIMENSTERFLWITELSAKYADEFVANITMNFTWNAQLLAVWRSKLPRQYFEFAGLLHLYKTCQICKTSGIVDANLPGSGDGICVYHPEKFIREDRRSCQRCLPWVNSTILKDLWSKPGFWAHGEFNVMADGCEKRPAHKWAPVNNDLAGYVDLPAMDPESPKYEAICLDAEMVATGKNSKNKEIDALVCISIVDVKTNQVLIHTLIKPDMEITDYREEYTGLNKDLMSTAEVMGKIMTLSQFHEQISKIANAKTIIVGWAVHNDLAAMKVVATRIFDLQIYWKSLRCRWGLPNLKDTAAAHKITIRKGEYHGSLEDTLATLEICRKILGPNKWLEEMEQARRDAENRKWEEYWRERDRQDAPIYRKPLPGVHGAELEKWQGDLWNKFKAGMPTVKGDYHQPE